MTDTCRVNSTYECSEDLNCLVPYLRKREFSSDFFDRYSGDRSSNSYTSFDRADLFLARIRLESKNGESLCVESSFTVELDLHIERGQPFENAFRLVKLIYQPDLDDLDLGVIDRFLYAHGCEDLVLDLPFIMSRDDPYSAGITGSDCTTIFPQAAEADLLHGSAHNEYFRLLASEMKNYEYLMPEELKDAFHRLQTNILQDHELQKEKRGSVLNRAGSLGKPLRSLFSEFWRRSHEGNLPRV